jgi:hypothetical protein
LAGFGDHFFFACCCWFRREEEPAVWPGNSTDSDSNITNNGPPLILSSSSGAPSLGSAAGLGQQQHGRLFLIVAFRTLASQIYVFRLAHYPSPAAAFSPLFSIAIEESFDFLLFIIYLLEMTMPMYA